MKIIKEIKLYLEKSQQQYEKEFNSRPICNKKLLKTKTKSYDDEAIDFHYKEIPKVGPIQSCLAVILIDFVLEKDENYYPQIFLKECKYIKKGKIVIRYISNDLKVLSDDSDQILLNKDV